MGTTGLKHKPKKYRSEMTNFHHSNRHAGSKFLLHFLGVYQDNQRKLRLSEFAFISENFSDTLHHPLCKESRKPVPDLADAADAPCGNQEGNRSRTLLHLKCGGWVLGLSRGFSSYRLIECGHRLHIQFCVSE